MDIVTRDEAKAAGAKRFFTGEACKRGHIAERYTSTESCVECDSMTAKERYRKLHHLFAAPAVEVFNGSRAAAADAGRRFYIDGTWCKRGHTGPRYVSSGSCAVCLRERNMRKYHSSVKGSAVPPVPNSSYGMSHVMDAVSYLCGPGPDDPRLQDALTSSKSDYDRGRLDTFIETIGMVVLMRVTGKSLEDVEKVLAERARVIDARLRPGTRSGV